MYTAVPVRSGKPPVKRDKVVRHLRRLIVAGQLAPGDRLPTHHDLKRRFDAEAQTIADVMRELSSHGFIETKRGHGSFVARHLPHLTQFALVFPYSPDPTLMPSPFYAALRAEADRWQNPERRVLPFYDIESHTDVEDYQRLLHFVESERLAGLIFAAPLDGLRALGSPVVQLPGLPRVVIQSSPDPGGFPALYPETSAFLSKAFDRLASCGCKRVAVVQAAQPLLQDMGKLAAIRAQAAARGLTVQPQWIQGTAAGTGYWARQLGQLLLQGAPGERPDALVIQDDSLVPLVTAGVVDSGVPVRAPGAAPCPGDLVVVAHANFPYPTPSAVPAMRLGYDIPAFVALCMKRLDQLRNGETPPAFTTVPPLWEGEVNGQWSEAPGGRASSRAAVDRVPVGGGGWTVGDRGRESVKGIR